MEALACGFGVVLADSFVVLFFFFFCNFCLCCDVSDHVLSLFLFFCYSVSASLLSVCSVPIVTVVGFMSFVCI